MMAEIEQFIAQVRMRGPLARMVADLVGSAEVQSTDLVEAFFAVVLS
ncbi:MAG TPA: hypothetical protein VFY83_10910 [Anaerolineales bacterium]|nr:hypothetical protein [Anaerolineales bacterium]